MNGSKIKLMAVLASCLGVLVIGSWLARHPSALRHVYDWRIKATYPSDRVATELKRICANEYHMTVEARRSGNTLQCFFWRVGLMKSGESEMRPEAAEALERVLLCATRIALSTDAPLRFIEVKMSDVLTGDTVTLWRYVPDVRDSMYDRMSEDEYINRLVLEMDLGQDHALEGQTPRWDTPITMEEFLAKQVVLRLKKQTPGLQAHEDLSEPQTLVVVIDNWPSIEKLQKARVTDSVEKSVKSVLDGYGFRGFHDVIMQDSRGSALRSWSF